MAATGFSDDDKQQIAYLFLESSSESSDDDNLEFLINNSAENKREKIENYIENVVHEYSDEDFRKNFRLNRNVATKLIDNFESSIFYPKNDNACGKKQISAENHVLSFLWFAGNKCVIRDVSSRFGIAESTFFRQFFRVMDFLIFIAPTLIKFPSTKKEKEDTEKDFRNLAGFPGVLGAIDGSYISIRTPAHKIKSTYTNRHDMTSMTLQGICDAKRRFLDVFTGIPSKIHDARVMRLSFINEELPLICGNEFHIIGDAAYPLREWLLTPFRGDILTEAQRLYNKAFCATRVIIENTFGILKQRFRQLTRLDFHTVDTMSKFILCCCVLHNMCINNCDVWDDELNEIEDDRVIHVMGNDDRNQRDALLKRLGEIKRENIAQSFA